MRFRSLQLLLLQLVLTKRRYQTGPCRQTVGNQSNPVRVRTPTKTRSPQPNKKSCKALARQDIAGVRDGNGAMRPKLQCRQLLQRKREGQLPTLSLVLRSPVIERTKRWHRSIRRLAQPEKK